MHNFAFVTSQHQIQLAISGDYTVCLACLAAMLLCRAPAAKQAVPADKPAFAWLLCWAEGRRPSRFLGPCQTEAPAVGWQELPNPNQEWLWSSHHHGCGMSHICRSCFNTNADMWF